MALMWSGVDADKYVLYGWHVKKPKQEEDRSRSGAVRGGLTCRVAFKQSLEGGEGVQGRTFQAEGVVGARVLRQEWAGILEGL